MSLSLREHVRVALTASRVDVVRVRPRWRREAHEYHTVAYDTAPGVNAENRAVSALGAALEPVRGRARTCSIVVSNTYVRYVLLPWRHEIRDAQAREAYARACLARVYGACAAGWTLTLDEVTYGKPVVVCAIDRGLLESLRAAVFDCGMRLASVRPFFGAAFNRCRRHLRDAALWFAVVEPERVCLAHVVRRGLVHFTAQRAGVDLGGDLAAMMARESLLTGATPQRLYIFAPGMHAASFAALPDLGTESWLLPGGDGRYAMALS